MVRTHFLFILAALTLGFSTAKAVDTTPESEESEVSDQAFVTPSYTEFRLMRPEKQEAYMEEVREMLSEVSENGGQVAGLFDSLNVSLTAKWTSFLSLLNNPATAAGDSSWCGQYVFTYNTSKGEYCVARDSIFGITRCGSTAQSYIKSCPTKFNQVRAQQESRIDAAAAASGKSGGEITQETQKFNAETAKTQQAVEAKAAQTPEKKYVDVRPQYPSTSTADTNLDKKPKKFRCIYAGFTIYGDDCKPETKYIDPKTNSVYTCSPTKAEGTEFGVVTPAKKDRRKTILCNPVFFGTVMGAGGKAEPICVARGKNATASCLKVANDPKNKEASLKAAVALAKGNKAKYEEMMQTVQNLCNTKPARINSMSVPDSVGFPSPTDGFSEASKKDLASTCEKYRERMFDYTIQYGSGKSYSPSPTAK